MRFSSAFGPLIGLGLIIMTSPALCADDSPSGLGALRHLWEDKDLSREQLVPASYVKSAEVVGDLNGDGIDDIAIILHQARKPGDDGDPSQAVAIFLGDNGGKFKLWKLGLHHFVESNSDYMDADGVGAFKINKGVLTIASSTAMSAGGWSAGGCTQKWRNGLAGFQLIGLTIVDMDRKCACGTTRDFNLVTGKGITTTDQGADGEQLDKEKVTKTAEKPQTILWDSFDYDKYCSVP